MIAVGGGGVVLNGIATFVLRGPDVLAQVRDFTPNRRINNQSYPGVFLVTAKAIGVGSEEN